MRIGVLGLGSMGSRRVRDLSALGHEVVGCDVRVDRNSAAEARFGIATVGELDGLLSLRPEALVISLPPDQHAKAYRAAFDARLPFFSEASILSPHPKWFEECEVASEVRGYPSATWRFYAPLVELRRLLTDAGALVLSAHHHYADFLPRWHPWESYWQFYAGARWQTCAAREMVPFELEWLCWLFGPVATVGATRATRRKWQTDIHDTFFLLMRFASGLEATLRIELHSLAPVRKAIFSLPDSTVALDFDSDSLTSFDPARGAWSALRVPESALARNDLEQVYAAEISAFVAAVEGSAEYPKSWAEDRHLSDVLVAAELSHRQGRIVSVNEVADSYTGDSLE